MPEHVVTVRRSSDDRTLLDTVEMFREVGSDRDGDYGESAGALATVIALRDELGSQDLIVYHVCNHDIGEGDCGSAVVEV